MNVNLVITSYSGRYNRKFGDNTISDKDKYLKYNFWNCIY